MRYRKQVMILLVALWLLAACRPGAPTASRPTASATVAPPVPTNTPTATVAPPVSTDTATVAPTVPADTPTATASPVPAEQPALDRIQMLDAGNGWAIGTAPEGRLAPILLTADGGVSWVERTPPLATLDAGPLSLPPAAFFQSPTSAWVSYPRTDPAATAARYVWITTDGGKSWNRSQELLTGDLPMDFFGPSDLGFLDAEHGWLLAHLGVGMSHDYIAIFTSGDGGQSWQRVADPEQTLEVQACPKTGLVFTSPADGWLAGDCPSLMPALFLYQTGDGGVTWTRATLPGPAELTGVTSDTLGNQCGIPQVETVETMTVRLILRCTDFDSSVSQAWLYSTADGGQSWQQSALPLASATFDFISLDEGWLFGAEQAASVAEHDLYHTADAGQTWTYLATIPQSGSLDFADAHHGWIAGGNAANGTLLYTEDGGQTWQER